jgi:hypothetical protein
MARNVVQPIFSSKLIHNFFREKKLPKTWARSEIFKKLPKEINHPTGENSPNLVTLVGMTDGIL